MKRFNNKGLSVFRKSLVASAILTSMATHAIDFKFGSGQDTVEMEWNNHFTYGAMYRTEDPSKENTESITTSPIAFFPNFPGAPGYDSSLPTGWLPLPDSIYNPANGFNDSAQAGRINNSNDGNLNHNGLVQNRVSVLSELSLNYKNFGAFVRARAWYDNVYKNGEPESWDGSALKYNDPDASSNDKYKDETVDYLGSEAEILDAYVFASFRIVDRPSSLKVGKQVINWGESMAFANSMNSLINPADANSGTRAGVDLKEVFMPTEAVYFQTALTQKISMQAFYQWKHRGTVLLPSGSFYSETDMLGAGGEYMWAGDNLIGRDDRLDEVKNGGQYGLAFTYFTDGGTEYGIYAANAHDKAPSLQVFGNQYRTWYAEDRKAYALSFSTAIGDTNVSGEYSYRPNAPVVLSANCVDLRTQLGPLAGSYPDQAELDALTCTTHAPSEVADASYSQAQVSMTNVQGGGLFWDQLVTAAEIVGWKYHSIDMKGVSATDEDLFFTNTSEGIGTLVRIGFDYFNVLNGANLSVPLTWQYGWTGTNSRTNSREGASIFSVGAALTFPNNIETSLVYTQYDGEDKDQTDPTFYHLHDRDNIAFSAKYSF